MKQRNLSMLLSTAAMFLLISCGSREDEKSSDATGTDTTANTSVPITPDSVSTIVTTPTNMMTVRHKVANYASWKMDYDGHDTARTANGIHSYVIGRSITDSNEVLVAMKIDDVAKAKAFGSNPSMKTMMDKAGVKGKSEINYTTMVWMDSSVPNSDLRSRTTFTVKDFDAWRKSFESQKQIRMDNGVVDRAFGYDIDNHNKVTLVVAITDTAKANAFWKSDQLKQLRKEAGTITEPQRFLYRVVQRY